MTNELVVLIDRLESEHGGVLDVVALVRSAVEERDDVALKGALAAGADELGTALTVHSQTEDDDLFPQLAEMIGEGLVGVFVEEHVRIRALRDQVYERMGQGEADFEGCAELCDLLSSHMERENQVLFPAARSVLAD
jgi:hemerythrin-like domain-containing protein